MRAPICCFLLLVCQVACGPGAPPNKLHRSARLGPEDYASLFESIRANGWRQDSALIWSYFFIDPDSGKLRQVAEALATAGYHLADLSFDTSQAAYWLKLDEVEQHTPASQAARGDTLYALADSMHVLSYDGVDVGPASTGGHRRP